MRSLLNTMGVFFGAFLATYLLSLPAFAQVRGAIDSEVSAAAHSNRTEVHLAGPIANHIRIDTIAELLDHTTPVVVTILGRASAVEPTTRDGVLTYYLARVDNNILGRPLPRFTPASMPAPLDAPGELDPKVRYLSLSADGGAIVVDGIRVTMEPSAGQLSAGSQYLLFLGITPDETSAMLEGDAADTLRIAHWLSI